MFSSDKNSHKSDSHYQTMSGQQWSQSSGQWSQLTTILLCCIAFLVSITSLIRTFSLEQKILRLEYNCDKYETIFNKLIKNFDLLSDNSINDINVAINGKYEDKSSIGRTTGIGDTLKHLIDYPDINTIIEEVFTLYHIK